MDSLGPVELRSRRPATINLHADGQVFLVCLNSHSSTNPWARWVGICRANRATPIRSKELDVLHYDWDTATKSFFQSLTGWFGYTKETGKLQASFYLSRILRQQCSHPVHYVRLTYGYLWLQESDFLLKSPNNGSLILTWLKYFASACSISRCSHIGAILSKP